MKWRVMGDYTVWCPELPGCTSAGETQQEALENIREAEVSHQTGSHIRITSVI